MHVLQMTAKVSTLSERLVTERALKRSHSCVLPEVISQVTALLKNTPTVRVFALEVELHSLSLRVLNSDSLVPLLRDPFESFVLASS